MYVFSSTTIAQHSNPNASPWGNKYTHADIQVASAFPRRPAEVSGSQKKKLERNGSRRGRLGVAGKSIPRNINQEPKVPPESSFHRVTENKDSDPDRRVPEVLKRFLQSKRGETEGSQEANQEGLFD